MLLLLLTKIISNLIYNKKLYLFANNASIKIINFKKKRLSYTKCGL